MHAVYILFYQVFLRTLTCFRFLSYTALDLRIVYGSIISLLSLSNIAYHAFITVPFNSRNFQPYYPAFFARSLAVFASLSSVEKSVWTDAPIIQI
jgi:hypothetical protein